MSGAWLDNGAVAIVTGTDGRSPELEADDSAENGGTDVARREDTSDPGTAEVTLVGAGAADTNKD